MREWRESKIKQVRDEMLKELYINGSMPYKKFRGLFGTKLGLNVPKKADELLQLLFDSELIRLNGEEVELTKEGKIYVGENILAEMKAREIIVQRGVEKGDERKKRLGT